MSNTETLSVPQALTGFVKIHQVDPVSGETTLLVDKQNMIMRKGATIIAHALGGDAYAKIWGMYVGYNNNEDFTKEQAPAITVDYSNPFSDFNEAQGFGYLREPLTFTPTYLSSPSYSENTVLFSTMITTAFKAGGAIFNTDSKIYEVALVATSPTGDTVFSRTNFNPIQYNSSYNFTITWGVRILVPEA